MARKKQNLGLNLGLPGSWGSRDMWQGTGSGFTTPDSMQGGSTTSLEDLNCPCVTVRMMTIQSTPFGCSILAKVEGGFLGRDTEICECV